MYFRPDNLHDALTFRAENRCRVAAGCTDLFPAIAKQCLDGAILDLTNIAGFRNIAPDGEFLRIGAAVTWSDIARANMPRAFDALKMAAVEVGSLQIQNAATVVGNICNASPAADGVPPLLALDANVEVSSARGSRLVMLSEFISGPRQIQLSEDEIVTALLIPQSSLRGTSHFIKLGARRYLVISIAMVAARLEIDEGRIVNAAIAVGSCSAVATRLPELEAQLIDQSISGPVGALVRPQLITNRLAPIGDIRADAEYRNHAAIELVRSCLTEAVRCAEGGDV